MTLLFHSTFVCHGSLDNTKHHFWSIKSIPCLPISFTFTFDKELVFELWPYFDLLSVSCYDTAWTAISLFKLRSCIFISNVGKQVIVYSALSFPLAFHLCILSI